MKMASTAADAPVLDGVGTLVIGVLLTVIAGVLAVEMRSLLIGESASAGDQTRIRTAVESHPAVRRVIHMRTEHLGPDELLVGVKVHFDPDLDTAGLARAINEVESTLRAAVPAARVVYIEPDIATTATTGGPTTGDAAAERAGPGGGSAGPTTGVTAGP